MTGFLSRLRTVCWASAMAGVCMVGALEAQVQVDDIVVTAGISGEGYSGNLIAVQSLSDSTEAAAAAVGEFGARMELSHLDPVNRSFFDLRFDVGLRQFAATGFKLRDYAPREWVGSVDGTFGQVLRDWGTLEINAGIRLRDIADRPPMPLFLQPGYDLLRASTRLNVEYDRFRLETTLRGRNENYHGTEHASQLDLLDKQSIGLELGLAAALTEHASLRTYGRLDWSDFPEQESFDPDDPTRGDRTSRMGVEFSRIQAPDLVDVNLGFEYTINRSNSPRPEYDARAVRAEVAFPLWRDVDVSLFGLLTEKDYRFETEFVRLVPGEEADNASILQVSFTKPLDVNLDGVLRFGWTRAETDIGDQYYQRWGFSLLFNYRP